MFRNIFIRQIVTMPPKNSKSKKTKTDSVVSTKPEKSTGPIKLDNDNNILIEIYAKPGAKQNTITDITEEGVNIQINAPPVEGSANTELVSFVAAFLGLKSSNVTLQRGHKSRNKVLKVSGNNISLEDVKNKFNAELVNR